MQYFYELLESYELLKQRKLKISFRRLAEQNDPNAESIAQQVVQQALASEAPLTQPFLPDPSKRLGAFVKKNHWVSGINGHRILKQVADLGGAPGPNWGEFVSWFAGEEGGQAPGTGAAPLQRIPPGETIAASQYGLEDPQIAEHFQEIGNLLSFVCKKLGNESIIEKIKESCTRFETYFVGASPQSLERKLSMAVGVAMDEADNILGPKNVDTSLVEGVARNLKDLVKILTKSEVSDDDRQFVENFFKISADHSIIIRNPYDPKEGVVFKDRGTNFLRSVIEDVLPDVNLEVVTKEGTTLDRGDIAWRGLHLEKILEPLILNSKAISASKMGSPEAEVYARLAAAATARLKNEVGRIIDVNSDWVTAFHSGDIAVTTEAAQVANSMAQILGDRFFQTAEALSRLAKDSLIIRKPDMVAPVGTLTGFGKKADTLEIWKLEGRETSQATEALKRQGISNPEDFIELMTIEKALADNPDIYNDLVSHGLYQKGEMVEVVGVSLKNYEDLADAKLGEFNARSVDGFISGALDLEDRIGAPERKLIKKKITQNLNFNDSDYSHIQNYQATLADIATTVNNLPNKARVRLEGGKIINTRPLEDYAKAVVERLKADNVYKEVIDVDHAVGEIVTSLTKIDWTKGEEAQERGKEVIKRYLIDARRQQDLKKEIAAVEAGGIAGPAMKHLAFETALISTSHKEILGDFRELNSGKGWVFNPNTAVYDSLNQFLQGKWKLTRNAFTVRIYDPNNATNNIRIRKKAKSENRVSGYKRSTTVETIISKGLMNTYKV